MTSRTICSFKEEHIRRDGVAGYVISSDEVYKYYFDADGNKIVDVVGKRSDLSTCGE